METVSAGHTMSLAALQRQDPFINKLLDVTGQVALYNFNSKTNEWEKTDIEGTLFVYSRSASPHHGFTIMNRLSTKNLVEPINKDLEFQLQDPFLLYRNGNLGIYSIWFYDKKDCQRIAQLMLRIVKQEADFAKGKTPMRTELGRSNGVTEPRPNDILELLSKAKEEYHRAQAGEPDVSSESKAKAAVGHRGPSPEKISHTMVKQITIEELFGSPLPREPSSPKKSPQESIASNHLPTFAQRQAYPMLIHQTPHITGHDPGLTQLHRPGLIPSPYAATPSPGSQPLVPRPDSHSHSSVSPLIIPSPSVGPSGPAVPSGVPNAYFRQESLDSIKPAVSSMNSDVHKPVLAASFIPNALVPPRSYQEPMAELFSKPPNLVKPMSTRSPASALPGSEISVLLSPSVFQQNINKATSVTTPVVPSPHELSSVPGGVTDALLIPWSRTQLQETLIHLIQNDPDFLSAIHEAYLQSLSRDFNNMKL